MAGMRAPYLGLVAIVVLGVLACGSSDDGETSSGAGTSGSGAGATGSGGGATGSGGGATGSTSTSTGAGGDCMVDGLLQGVGKDHVLAGASMDDATAASAPFDLRYLYISGGLFDGAAPCASCAAGCTAFGQSCDNANGCAWWGCWQYDQDPPGAYIRNFVATALGDGQIPMITYYEALQASGAAEGAPEVGAMNDAAFLGRYLADWRFLLQQVGQSVAFLHIEPDFWGYAEQMSQDPHSIAAAVAAANPTDCAGEESSIAGLARCMIAMARTYAPNARVGLHGSGWGTNFDVLQNSDPGFDVAGEAQKLGAFLVACGGDQGDFVVVDASDRDAGYYQSIGQDSWWDDTDATLPNFAQAFSWSKTLAESVGRPIVWWQLPVGNMSLPDQNNAWKDNRVDYFFAHTAELAASHGAAMAFGAGDGNQTTPESDGGNLVSKTQAYAASGFQPPCP